MDAERSGKNVIFAPQYVLLIPSSMVTIKKVEGHRDLRAFIRFNYHLYKGNPYAVPDFLEDMYDTFNKKKNAAFEFCEGELFLAYRDGKIVGLDETMEYSADGGETFIGLGDAPTNFACDVEYIIRYKANDTDFCSEATAVTIKSGRKLIVTFVAEGEELAVYEVAYGEVIEVPELPALENCDMEASRWSIDLVDVPIVEDVTVTAVYQKLDGCGRPIPNEAAILLVAFSALAFVVFKRKN